MHKSHGAIIVASRRGGARIVVSSRDLSERSRDGGFGAQQASGPLSHAPTAQPGLWTMVGGEIGGGGGATQSPQTADDEHPPETRNSPGRPPLKVDYRPSPLARFTTIFHVIITTSISIRPCITMMSCFRQDRHRPSYASAAQKAATSQLEGGSS